MEGPSESVTAVPLGPSAHAACMSSDTGEISTSACGDGLPLGEASELSVKTGGEDMCASTSSSATVPTSAITERKIEDNLVSASEWDGMSRQQQQQQSQLQQQHQQLQQHQSISSSQSLGKAGDDGGGGGGNTTAATVNNGGGGTCAPSASTATSPAPHAASPAAGALGEKAPVPLSLQSIQHGLRALEEEVRNLDADWDELQKLHDMTEEAAYSLTQSGGGSLQAAHPGSPNAATAAPAGSVTQGGGPGNGVYSDIDEVDRRSVYVGNVEYSSTPAELQEHFKACGTINRITIMVDRYTGHPKGYAYIEFNSEAAVQNAILLSDTVFKHRQIKVVAKRKNIPGFARARGGWRGSRVAMAGAGGIPRGLRGGRGGFRPIYRPRGGGMRGYGRPY